MRELLQDVRYGTRLLFRQPSFTTVVGLTLAVAIGANAVIFSIASFLLLRPLPFQDHETLVALYSVDPQRGDDRSPTSLPDFLEWREQTTSFEAIGAFAPDTVTLTGRGEPERLQTERVSANLFDIWRVEMAAGRGFHAGEDLPGAAPVAIISHGYWTRAFSADPGMVGQTLTLDGRPHTVVGIVTPDLEIGNLSQIDVWAPLTLNPDASRQNRALQVHARLRPDVSVDQATAEIAGIADRQARDNPTTSENWTAHAMPLLQALTGRNSWLVLSLLGIVVAFVLAIACANVANLMLARSVARRKELAIRAAIGAGRMRLVRQLITESLLLGVIGGAIGLLIAQGGLAVIHAVSYEPFFKQIELDFRVLAFVGIISLLTPMLFSLLPALQAARVNLNETLLEGSGRTSGGVKHRRSRSLLVVAQLSLAVVLLVLSTLVVRTAIAQSRLDVGFDPANILTLQIELDGPGYDDEARQRQFFDASLEQLAALPGVVSAATTNAMPVFSPLPTRTFTVDGRPDIDGAEGRPWALAATVSPGYFETFDVPLVEGRRFTADDAPDAVGAVLISAETRRRYFADTATPVGRRVRLTDDGPWLTVVGVVGDVYNRQALVEGFDPQLYLPASQHVAPAAMFAIRTAGSPEALQAEVRRVIQAQAPDQAVYDVRSMDQAFSEAVASDRLLFGMFVTFAVVALLLASSGLYALMAYSVEQRRQEFGVRLALGAQGRDVVRQVVRQGLVLTGIGIALGLVGGLGLALVVADLLFGVTATDPTTYAGVAGILMLVAAAACYLPARRAVSIDPIRALR